LHPRLGRGVYARYARPRCAETETERFFRWDLAGSVRHHGEVVTNRLLQRPVCTNLVLFGTVSAQQCPIKQIAASIGKSFQTVYREIKRNSKPDGRYQPWWAHNQALLRRKRPKEHKIRANGLLQKTICDKLAEKWSPQQISRYLLRTFPHDPIMCACPETIYQALFAGLLGRREGKLRTGRTRRKKQRRGVAPPNKIKNMRSIHQRPAEVNERQTAGHWEGDLIIGGGQGAAISEPRGWPTPSECWPARATGPGEQAAPPPPSCP